MPADPYATLGVARDASHEEIRKAYRKLAREHHPDLNPNNPEAEEKFKEISAAFAVLGDEEKRKQFDRGEIDASGEQVQHERTYYRDYADQPGGFKYRVSGDFDPGDLEDLFGGFFGRERGGADVPMRGRNERYTLEIEFVEAARGSEKAITMPSGKRLSVTIPAGVRDGQTIRLAGQGGEGRQGGPPGDALITLRVKPDERFRREGRNIHSDLPVNLETAVLGGEARVETVHGPVSVTIPAGSNTDSVLRLKGKGVGGKGNHLVHLKIVLKDPQDADLREFLQSRRGVKA